MGDIIIQNPVKHIQHGKHNLYSCCWLKSALENETWRSCRRPSSFTCQFTAAPRTASAAQATAHHVKDAVGSGLIGSSGGGELTRQSVLVTLQHHLLHQHEAYKIQDVFIKVTAALCSYEGGLCSYIIPNVSNKPEKSTSLLSAEFHLVELERGGKSENETKHNEKKTLKRHISNVASSKTSSTPAEQNTQISLLQQATSRTDGVWWFFNLGEALSEVSTQQRLWFWFWFSVSSL